MPNFGQFVSALGNAALGGAGPAGRTALASRLNTRDRLAQRESELASVNQRASDMLMLGAIREAKGSSQWQTLPQQDRDRLDGIASDMEQRNSVPGFTSIPVQQEAQETFSPVRDNDGNIVGQKSSTSGKVISDPRAQEEDPAKPLSEIAKLNADVRNGFVTRAQANAQIESKLKKDDNTPFGNSRDGLATAKLLEVKKRRDSNKEISQELMDQAVAAEFMLNRPRIVMGANGERFEYTPGVPPGLGVTGEQPESLSVTSDSDDDVIRTPGGGTLAQVQTRNDPLAGARDRAVSGIVDILDLLDEAKKAGEVITGVQGAAKAKGGGLARQAGIPVTTRSKDLDRKLEALQALASPIILNEKRITDTERERVNKIVGQVSAFTDEEDIRSALMEVINILELDQ